MQLCRKTAGGAVLGTLLLAIGLAVPPPARSQQAATPTVPPASNLQTKPSTTDDVSAQNPDPDAANSQDSQLAVNPITGMTSASASHFTPLTGRQRWKLYWKQDYFSFGAYFKPTLFALVLDQATDSPAQWGGGFKGFGLREASRIGGNIVSGTIRAPLSDVLHEDVRYISDQHHGSPHRILHAVEYSVLTYDDQGHSTLNIAKLVSYYASTAISTAWHPAKHSIVEYTFANSTEQIGLSVPFNVLQEFWPNIVHKKVHR